MIMQIYTNQKSTNYIRYFFKWDTQSIYRIRILCMLICCVGILRTANATTFGTPKIKDNTSSINKLPPFVLSGIVVDEKDEPLPGASVKIKGTTKGVVTDVYGKFLIEVPSENDSLVVSFVTFKTKTVHIGNVKNIKVSLDPDIKGRTLNETVVTAFGSTQKKTSLTAAITTVKVSDLQKSPVPSLSNALGGKVTGVITRQVSGSPGADGANIYIRGVATSSSTNPLILIDGVERDINTINVEEIESFTVLKDASSTAVYGIRGANGVILITTKRGVAGTPKVTLRTETAIDQSLRLPNYINAFEYATLVNEARFNSGLAPQYTASDLQKYQDHSDPYLHPDVDWVDATLKKSTMQSVNNLNIRGGNETFKYYSNVGYTVQQGIFKEDPDVSYSSNTSYKRYNFRNNVDVSLSKTFSVALNVGGNVATANYPGYNLGNFQNFTGNQYLIFEFLNLTPNNAFPLKNPNGTNPGISGTLNESPYVKVTQKGYQRVFRSNVQTSLEPKWDLSKLVTSGLTARGLFAYDFRSSTTNTRSRTAGTFQYTGKDANGVDQYKTINTETALGYDAPSSIADRNLQLELTLDYNRTFGKHAVTGLVVARRIERVDMTAGSSIQNLPFRQEGYATRLTYGYDNRYLIEGNLGYTGSENFAPGKKFGFFPAGSVGWLISNEKFWNPAIINSFKIRGSYGLSGNDQIGGDRFLFQTTINKAAGNYSFGESPTTQGGAFSEARIGNEAITWEVARKLDIGTDISILNGKIDLTIDLFKEHRTNILLQRQQIPLASGYPSSIIPYANLGIIDNKGFEVSLDLRNQTKSGFYYAFSSRFTFSRNIWVEDDKPYKALAYQNSRGNSLNESYGYIALGLFQNQNEINNSPSQTALKPNTAPGDVKYQDLNGDGKITTDDQTFIGYGRTPEIMFGFGPSFAYKGFDLSAWFTGAAHTNMDLGASDASTKSRAFWAFYDQGFNVLRGYYDNHWVPGADNTNAKYPAVTSTQRHSNNYVTSTLWLRNGDYLRLSTAEIGYTLPKSIIQKLHINKLRLFVNGQNLAIWDHIKIINPEDNNTNENYPLTRNINFGALIGF